MWLTTSLSIFLLGVQTISVRAQTVTSTDDKIGVENITSAVESNDYMTENNKEIAQSDQETNDESNKVIVTGNTSIVSNSNSNDQVNSNIQSSSIDSVTPNMTSSNTGNSILNNSESSNTASTASDTVQTNQINVGEATSDAVDVTKNVAETNYANSDTASKTTQIDETITEPVKNGLIEENGQTYYYANGNKLSDVQLWQGKWYYFNHDTFQMERNVYTPSNAGNWYLFGADGYALTDVQPWLGGWYYFDHNTYLKRTNAYLTSNAGNSYLFGADGYALTDVQPWLGGWYYFDHNTYLKRTNAYLTSNAGNSYLFGADGYALTDVQPWAGTWFYFDHKTFLKRTNAYLQSNNGNWYMFGSGGEVQTVYSYGGCTYYFNPSTFLLERVVPNQKTENGVDYWTIGDPMRPQVNIIDISSHQSSLIQDNYNMMKSLGIQTVIVKITEGNDYINPFAAEQIRMAQAANLKVAVYDYAKFRDYSNATDEAAHMVNTLRNLGLPSNTLLIADMENEATANENVASNLNGFWQTLSNNGYWNHSVYTFLNYAYRDAVVNTVGQSRVWMSQYLYSPHKWSIANSNYGAWQLSSTAYLPGYSGSLDVSLDYNGLLLDV
jgi:glucan-binding YG repeat protein/GH25 family lysozyme M1 (1,4-beta-N-acetylmuramidase)